jgi:site-specific DNA recombinase
MRAAIYARYSSDNQREASIDDQVRLCNAWLSAQGHGKPKIYKDKAISGATMLRPGIQSLLTDCMAGNIDLVIAEALDRVSRDQEDIAGIFKRLTFAGVKLITLSEGEVTDLHVGLKGTMNALFLKDLADKTRRGLRGRVEAGCSGGGNSYGYEVIPGVEGDRGKRRIENAEAKIIISILKDYASGMSPRKIAFALNAEKIPGPAGKDWGPSTINGNAARGTGILNNELYIGRLVWNRLRYVKNPDTGKRISKQNPPEEWVINGVPELRIVPQDLWDSVKTRQQGLKKNTRPDINKDRPFWERTRPKYLLSGLMKCGSCGGSYTKISANLFGCATARNKGTCTNRLNIRRDNLENIILDGLKEQLMDPVLFEVFVREFKDELNRLQHEQGGDVEALKKELERIERQIDKLVMAIAEGANALSLNTKITELEERRNTLMEDISAQADAPLPFVHPNLAEVYRRKVARLSDLLEDPLLKNEAFEVIRTLIDEVRLSPDNGVLRIDLKGELEGIISLCNEKKNPGHTDRDNAEQIKMVAGACNNQAPTLTKFI